MVTCKLVIGFIILAGLSFGQFPSISSSSNGARDALSGSAGTLSKLPKFTFLWSPGVILDGGCTSALFTVIGASTTTTLAVAWPSTLNAGIDPSMVVIGTNQVRANLCNLSGGPLTPMQAIYSVTLLN